VCAGLRPLGPSPISSPELLRRQGRVRARAPAANSGTFRFQRVLFPLNTQRFAPRFDGVAVSPATQAANAARLAAQLAADAADAAAYAADDLEALAAQEEINSITSMSSATSSNAAFLPADDVEYTPSDSADNLAVPTTQKIDFVSASMGSASLYCSSMMEDSHVPTSASSDYHPTHQSVTM